MQLRHLIIFIVTLLCSGFSVSIKTCQDLPARRRILIVQVDNRPLIHNSSSLYHESEPGYWAYAAILNSGYAKRHGYGYNYVHLGDNASSHVLEYLDRPEFRLFFEKHKLQCGNDELGQLRAAPWCKIPALWHLLRQQQIIDRYDWIAYLDSDAVFNFRDEASLDCRRIEDLFDLPYNETTDYGPHLAEASIAFLSNRPDTDPYPCTGVILLSVQSNLTQYLMKEWWNTNFTKKNFVHDFEQGGYRLMQKENHCIVRYTTYLKEVQFFASWPSNLWIVHVGSAQNAQRIHIFRELIESLHLDKWGIQESIISLAGSVVALNVTNITRQMMLETYKSGQYHDIDNSSCMDYSPAQPVFAGVGLGHWEVKGGMKRMFVSGSAFAKYHDDWSEARGIGRKEFDLLINGPPMTADPNYV